jgi:hypothetical protein
VPGGIVVPWYFLLSGVTLGKSIQFQADRRIELRKAREEKSKEDTTQPWHALQKCGNTCVV